MPPADPAVAAEAHEGADADLGTGPHAGRAAAVSVSDPAAAPSALSSGSAPAPAPAPAAVPAPAPAPAAPRYTVSVRSLCEFTAKQGDLDRRFTPSATALEGLRGQQLVATRRGPDYETEVALSGDEDGLRVRGRADGYDPSRHCLEEVKTIRGRAEDIPENRRHLHWAQLLTYGALFCRQRGCAEVWLALVYFDVDTQQETVLQELFGAETLEAGFRSRCAAFQGWAGAESAHRAARDAALVQIGFPPGRFRPGQRTLAEAVYRAAAQGRSLLCEAPTGIGKTVGTLFPTLRALPGQGIDKLVYLTCKGSTRPQVLATLQALRDTLPSAGRSLRVLVAEARENACEHPDKACHGDACPLARGFYDRLSAARQAAVDAAWLDGPAVRTIALQHGLCPYYLGQELLRWVDVIVADAHHLFDPNGQAAGLQQALDWRLAVLVDEAHNLVDRTRAMYSAELDVAAVERLARGSPGGAGPVPGAIASALLDWTAATRAWADTLDGGYALVESPPESFALALQSVGSVLADHFQRHPLAVGALLETHFALHRFTRLLDSLGDAAVLEVDARRAVAGFAAGPTAAPAADPLRLAIRCVVPARHLRPRWKALHSAVLFSATLSPPDYALQMLGLPEDTVWCQVPPVFDPSHLQVRVATGLSTRFPDRGRSREALVRLMASQFDAEPGNYLAFFSSFEYLDHVAEHLARVRPDIAQWRQSARMGSAARQFFLDRFRPDGHGIGFAVLGGLFSEGVDLPGTRLIGAFIATLGLPPVSPLQDAMRERMTRVFGPDQRYADLVPAMQKVVQAAGRILRTPNDRGHLWLMDDRYGTAAARELLPEWWFADARPSGIIEPGDGHHSLQS